MSRSIVRIRAMPAAHTLRDCVSCAVAHITRAFAAHSSICPRSSDFTSDPVPEGMLCGKRNAAAQVMLRGRHAKGGGLETSCENVGTQDCVLTICHTDALAVSDGAMRYSTSIGTGRWCSVMPNL